MASHATGFSAESIMTSGRGSEKLSLPLLQSKMKCDPDGYESELATVYSQFKSFLEMFKQQAAQFSLPSLQKPLLRRRKASESTNGIRASSHFSDPSSSTTRKGSNFGTLHKKLFGKGTSSSSSEKKKEVKALTEVKGNTRTLAMVLRSERELLSLTKDQYRRPQLPGPTDRRRRRNCGEGGTKP